MLSPAALQDMRTEALVNAVTVYGLLIGADQMAVEGREAEALKCLTSITGALPFEIQAIKQVLAAEREAAKARDLTQRTLAPFFGTGKAEEHLNPANDEHPSAPDNLPPTVA